MHSAHRARDASISIPIDRTPARAALIRVLPSPQPMSYTTSPGWTPVISSMASSTGSGVLHSSCRGASIAHCCVSPDSTRCYYAQRHMERSDGGCFQKCPSSTRRQLYTQQLSLRGCVGQSNRFGGSPAECALPFFPNPPTHCTSHQLPSCLRPYQRPT